jgi:uncharacterized protein YdaU (DUF1376 family)
MATKTKGRAGWHQATPKTSNSPDHNPKPPAAPLRLLINIPEWRFETEAMTTAECGALLKLKMHFWRNGTLPDRDQALAQITGLSPAAWKKARKALEPRFIVLHGEWQRTDWSDELAEAYQAISRSKDFSKAGNDARWGKHRTKKHPAGSPAGSPEGNPKRNPKETLRSKAPSQGLNSSNGNTFEADVRAAEIDLGLLLAGRST